MLSVLCLLLLFRFGRVQVSSLFKARRNYFCSRGVGYESVSESQPRRSHSSDLAAAKIQFESLTAPFYENQRNSGSSLPETLRHLFELNQE